MEPIQGPLEFAGEDAALRRYVQAFVPHSTEAQDVVQDTWLAALQGDTPHLWRNPRGWLRVVARRIVQRERARRSLRTESERTAALGSRERSRSAEVELEREAAQRAVSTLEEPYRTVIRLRFFEELSIEEIAHALERPPATVRSQIHRGVAQVRARMSPRQRSERRWGILAGLWRARPAGEPGRLALALGAFVAVALVGGSLWFGLRPPRAAGAERATELAAGLGVETVRFDQAPLAGPARAAPAPEAARESLELSPAPAAAELPAEPGHTLEIEVVDAQGSPVSGALVSVVLRSSEEPRGVSDERGRCRIELVETDAGAYVRPATLGRVTLLVSSLDHATSSLVHVPLELCDGRALGLSLGGPPLELGGRILDEAGRPVPGAFVSCGGAGGYIPPPGDGVFESPWLPEVCSDDRGGFAFTGLEKKPQFVRVFAPGFLELRERLALPTSSTDRLECTLVLRRGATLSGTVHDPLGRPAAGVLVFEESPVRPTEWSARLAGYEERLIAFVTTARTDARGAFALTGIVPGKRRMWALSDAGVASAVFALDSERPSTWEAELVPASGLALRVLDEHGAPCPGLRVRLSNTEEGMNEWMRCVVTDEQGRVRVPDCLEFPTSAEVLDERMVDLLARVTDLRPGAEEHVIVVPSHASASGIVRGILLGPDGLPFPAASLKRYDTETLTAIALNLDRATGRFEQAFPPGRFLLACVVDRRGFSLGELELAAGEILDLGVQRAEPTGMLVLLPGAAPALATRPESFRLSVRYPSSGPPIFRELLRGSWPPPEELELFPGRHWLEVVNEASGVIFRTDARVVAGTTAWMDLP